MFLSELTRLVLPPKDPLDAGTPQQWTHLEQTLGTPLPSDYKQLVMTYGVGWFANWIAVFSPFSPGSNLNLTNPALWQALADNGGYTAFHHGFPVFPAAGGLLPWGQDDNAHPFCWLTVGPPDTWEVISLDRHYSQAYRHIPVSLTELLAGWFAGRITGDWYPEDVFPLKDRVFSPGYQPRY